MEPVMGGDFRSGIWDWRIRSPKLAKLSIDRRVIGIMRKSIEIVYSSFVPSSDLIRNQRCALERNPVGQRPDLFLRRCIRDQFIGDAAHNFMAGWPVGEARGVNTNQCKCGQDFSRLKNHQFRGIRTSMMNRANDIASKIMRKRSRPPPEE